MIPTKEQEIIIKALQQHRVMKVCAFAGTGKTSTLLLMARAYPHLRGLYLAYNKAIQEEASKAFPPWVHCSTLHGLAYKTVGKNYKNQLGQKTTTKKVIEALGLKGLEKKYALKQEGSDDSIITITTRYLVEWIKNVITDFEFSGKSEINSENFNSLIQKDIYKHFPELQALPKDTSELIDFILRQANRLWNQKISLKDVTIPCTHDAYLKLYQLSNPQIRGYDTRGALDYIMLDEAQDANGCVLDILQNQFCRVIYIGDPYQQIYAFRGSINAMDSVKAPEYYLTQSFRFGEAIAKEANIVLKGLGSLEEVQGWPMIESRLQPVRIPYTFIARCNATLLETYLEKTEEGYKVQFENITAHLDLISRLYAFWEGKAQLEFKTWEDFVVFAKKEEDGELLSAIKFIDRFQGKTLKVIDSIKNNSKHLHPDIILTTAHRSKGREWNKVMLANDFSLDRDSEKNLYYVAITRAKYELEHRFPLTKEKSHDNGKT